MEPGPRILIVDDSEFIRTMLVSMLHGIGIRNISQAEDGLDALGQIRLDLFDIVLLDMIMPRMGGLELLRVIRAEPQFDYIKVIIVTSAAGAKVILAAKNYETRADAVIVKPFSSRTLQNKIIRVMTI